jgi:hypothetical protein
MLDFKRGSKLSLEPYKLSLKDTSLKKMNKLEYCQLTDKKTKTSSNKLSTKAKTGPKVILKD